MNLRDFPHIQAALSDVYPILPSLTRALDEGATQARTTLDSLHALYEAPAASSGRRNAYDPWYLSHTVRYVARLHLMHRGYDTELELDDVANSGLRVRYKSRAIYVRKATADGGVPIVNNSEIWRGIMQLILSEEFACTSPKLMFLYHVTPFAFFEGLSVVFGVPSKRHQMGRVLGCLRLPNLVESDALEGLWQREESNWAVEALSDLPIDPLTAEEDSELGQRDDSGLA